MSLRSSLCSAALTYHDLSLLFFSPPSSFTHLRKSTNLHTFLIPFPTNFSSKRSAGEKKIMFTTRLVVKAISASRFAVNNATFAQRRSVHDIKLPHHEDHVAASEYTRHLQHLLAIKESEIKEKDSIISTLRAQKRQNQQNQTTNAQNNTTIWTGGMTDTDGFGAGWRGKGWDRKVERKEGRMRELMRGMTARERERYDHL